MSGHYQESRFTSAEEFLAYLRPSNSVWHEGLDNPWLFRGHADATWELLPSSLREEGKAALRKLTGENEPPTDAIKEALFVKFGLGRQLPLDAPVLERFIEAFYQARSEVDAVAQFASLADKLGMRIPDEPQRLSALSWYANRVGPVLSPLHFRKPEVFGYAQHHGIPTSLLDWTENSLIAAFFAAQTTNTSVADLCVWAVYSKPLESNCGLSVLRCRRANHSYLHAQSGLFLFDHNAYDNYVRHGRWIRHDEFFKISHRDFANSVKKLILPRAAASELLRSLWREQISRAHLMPTLDNVSSTLQQRWHLM